MGPIRFINLQKALILLIPLSCTFVRPSNGAMMKIGELATLNGVKLETVLDYFMDSIKFDENSHQVTINPDVISQKEDYVLSAIHVKESVQDYLRNTLKSHGSSNGSLTGEKAFVALKEIITDMHKVVTTNKKSGVRVRWKSYCELAQNLTSRRWHSSCRLHLCVYKCN
ncbi:hypothetical protein DdX_13908 [Ditylenchus destructor]|uniref:Uncharacterized protein n=1 Tax=Ditylenchus destructor TaxID=166010 RepID=A0AAD4R2C3_9BILA|nr:hypothetical protein DdX_13908 [Ditylenchus destructor]